MVDFKRFTNNIWFTIEDQPGYKDSFHTRADAEQFAENHDLDPDTIKQHEIPEGLRSYTETLSIRLDALGESFELCDGTDEDVEAFVNALDNIRDGLDELEQAAKGNQDKVEHPSLAHAKNTDYPSPPSTDR